MKAEYLKLSYVLLKTEVRRETEKNEAKEIGRNKKPKGILSPLKLDFHKPLLTASLVAQMLKSLPAMQETWVRLLGWDDPLEESMATHSSILA